MQSTFSGLNTMVNGIYTNRLALNTVGHNISSSNTPGYSRQRANSVATMASEVYTLSGAQQVGNGSTVSSVARARDIYADRQYWKENATDGYYNAKASNYSKLESIFNDSDNTGVQNAMENFFKSWQYLSTDASNANYRISVIGYGENFADSLKSVTSQTQKQITSIYDSIELTVNNINSKTNELVTLNKAISGIEATGAIANDLRDQRDMIIDELSGLMNINVYETPNHMYTVVSDGTTLVNGLSRVDLEMSVPVNNKIYGINDYDIIIKQTGTTFQPSNGELGAQLEAIKEDKKYIDNVIDMATFMLTTLNDQHKAGQGIDADKTTKLNFFGHTDYEYTWTPNEGFKSSYKGSATPEILKGIEILKLLYVNKELQASDGELKIAAGKKKALDDTSTANSTADGSNATAISTLFNCIKADTGAAVRDSIRSIGDGSLYSFYNSKMTAMGSSASNMNEKVAYQKTVMTQVENLRSATAGVNWDEELTNMIKFQQGYQACSRCLNAMDECLEKLVNGTGMVGR